MLHTTIACFRFCVFQGSVPDVNGDSATIFTFLLLLIVLELNPLVSLFTDSELAFKLLQHRITIWLMALLWHALAIAMIYAVLKLKHSVSRFRELLASYLGVFLLFQFVGVLLQLTPLESLPSLIRIFLLLVWLSWSCCVFGYVFGSALSIKLFLGTLVALFINVVCYLLAFVLIGLIFSDQLFKVIHQHIAS